MAKSLGGYMKELIILMLVLAMTLANLAKLREIEVRVYISKLEGLTLLVSWLVFLGLALAYGKSPVHYLLSLALGGFLASSYLARGFSSQAFYSSPGRGLLVRKLDLARLDDISFYGRDKKKSFCLKLKSGRMTFFEKFSLDQKEEILLLMDRIDRNV